MIASQARLAFSLVGLFALPTAHAIDCVQPPPTYLRDYSAQLQASALKVRGLAGPSAGLAVKAEAKNLLDKIPNADKVLLELSYLYALCTALRDDAKLSEERKARMLVDYRRAMAPPPPASPVPTPRPAAPPPSATSAAGGQPSQVISNNTGPVVTNNTVQGNLTVGDTKK